MQASYHGRAVLKRDAGAVKKEYCSVLPMLGSVPLFNLMSYRKESCMFRRTMKQQLPSGGLS